MTGDLKVPVLLKQIVFGLSVFAFLLFIPSIVNAEAIQAYQTTLTLEKTGVVHVVETIRYDFGELEKHGMYRDIPLTSDNGPRIRVDRIAVTDENQNAYQFIQENPDTDTLRIKIGDPDRVITGVHTYAVSYDVSNVIRHFNDHDELYWNAIGTKWNLSIASAEVRIVLPEEITVSERNVVCFVGLSGSTSKDCAIKMENGHEITILSSRSLADHEGMTAAVTFPTGVVTGLASKENEPTAPGGFEKIKSFLGIALFLVFFLFMLFIIARNQGMRAPKELKHEPLVVAYEPPEGVTPVDVGVIIDRKLDPSDVPSIIIDLAIKGYLKIRYLTNKGFFGNTSQDYEFVKLKEGDDLNHPAYRIVWAMLFGEADAAPSTTKIGWLPVLSQNVRRDAVKMSDIESSRQTNASYFSRIGGVCDQYLFQQGLMKRTHIITLKPLESVFLLLSFLSIFIFPMVGVPLIIFFFILKSRGEVLSEKGIDAFRKIRGFREFLSRVEADKMRLLNAPEVEPAMFEKFLPYAMIFGVAGAWARKFEGMALSQPSWIDTSNASWGMGFSSVALADSLSDMGSHFSSAFASSSGGGGSSGGGSGGGGGGSW